MRLQLTKGTRSGEKYEHGVGFMVRKKDVNPVMEFRVVSNRITAIRLRGKPKNVTSIEFYAPTASHDDEMIERFYSELEDTIKGTPKKDILIIQDDWIANVGVDAHDIWGEVVGRYGVVENM